jgi:hypothetical protein
MPWSYDSRNGQDFSCDMVLREVEVHDQQHWDSGPQLDVQLKSTTGADVQETEVVHDLEVRADNLLRLETCLCQRILVLLVLPEDETQWLTQSVDELILRRCAYWMSFRGAEPTANQTTIRIAIPRANVFSVEALRRLLEGARPENRP